MANLLSAYNPTYSKNASVLTGNPNRVTVEVEDNIDAHFWKDILSNLCPQKEFHFNPFQTITLADNTIRKVKGKSHIMSMAAQLNEWHIGCVDSDYDWLLSEYTKDGNTLSSSQYLLQTYAYSIENLVCLSSTLNELCDEITKETSEFSLFDYTKELSHTIYPLLVWSLYFCSKNNHSFTPTCWHDILINTYKTPSESLEQIRLQTQKYLNSFQTQYANEIELVNSFGRYLFANKNLTEDNAYLFVRGHELFDHLAYSILQPIITDLRKEHNMRIKSSDMDEQLRNAILKEYNEKGANISKLLYQNYRYKGRTYIYNKIEGDIAAIW